ncbi:MAG: flagellin [Candidatus Eremiobacteraeota bacterium]|nr:flagellin [Candidatus Eremiobacteraeota bacterium]
MQFDRLSDGISLAFGRNQKALADATARLSSGLRITTAADDPSGLAIAESLHAQAQGLDQGQHSVQDGVNALTVADAALETVQEILQRMRTLIVEGRSDLVSDGQRQGINYELGQLGREIDTIAGKTEFNGRKLLDGSLSDAIGTFGTSSTPKNDVLASGETLIDPTSLVVNTTNTPLDLKITIDAYDPATNLVTYTIDAKSTDQSQTFLTSYPASSDILSGQNYDNFWNSFPGPVPPGVSQQQISDGAGLGLIQFVLGHVSAADVGKSAFVYTVPPVLASGGHPIQIGLGRTEGDIVTLSAPGVSQYDLDIVGVRVDASDTITLGSEYRVDAAMETVGGTRAELGAQIVSLGESANDAAIQQVAVTASQSAIRDLNVAQEMTQYTKLQILTTTQTHLLRSVEDVTLNVFQLLTAGLR